MDKNARLLLNRHSPKISIYKNSSSVHRRASVDKRKTSSYYYHDDDDDDDSDGGLMAYKGHSIEASGGNGGDQILKLNYMNKYTTGCIGVERVDVKCSFLSAN